MIVTHKIKMDLTRRSFVPAIDAVQNDRNSRALELALYSGEQSWSPPEGTYAMVCYSKSDGRGGEYSTLSDGSAAVSIQGNLVTVALASQVLTTPGHVGLSIRLFQGTSQVSTFQILVNVHPGTDAQLADEEESPTTGSMLPIPATAEAGQYLRVGEVNGAGVVISTYASDPVVPDLSRNDPTAGDYVKGRTHWIKGTVNTEMIPETEFGHGVLMDGPIGLVEGMTYSVSFDGVIYRCLCTYQEGLMDDESVIQGLTLGNYQHQFGIGDTGEPFCLFDNAHIWLNQSATVDNKLICYFTDEGSHLIHIFQSSEAVQHLPTKFLSPDVRADLTQTDPEVFGFVKGLTQGRKKGECLFSALEFSGEILFVMNDSLVLGETYIVALDQTEYTCVCKAMYSDHLTLYYLGCLSIAQPALNGTSEPFLLQYDPLTLQCIIITSDTEMHTISLYRAGKTFNKLPEDLIPDQILLPKVSAADAGKILVVHSQGHWIAAETPGIVLLSQAEYEAMASAGTLEENALYVIEG